MLAPLAALLLAAAPHAGKPAPSAAPAVTAAPATPPAAEEGSAAPSSPPPAPRSAADSVVAAAFGQDVGTLGAPLKADSAGPSAVAGATSLVVPFLAIAGLGLLAAAVTRRRAQPARSIRVVETASVGHKRELVVADVLGERLVLAVSEAGIAVLSTRPAPAPTPQPVVVAPQPLRLPPAQPLSAPAAPRMGFFERLMGKPRRAARSFEAELAESLEDQELRAKLAAGVRGTVS